MAQRVVDGPPGVWSGTREAARWLGLSVAEFRREARGHPGLLVPRKFGKSFKYHWLDLVGYSWYRSRQSHEK